MEILTLGDPRLRRVADPIQVEDLPQLQPLIDQLVDQLQAAAGVGIAAPQVGQNLQLLILASHPNRRYPNAPLMEPTPLINPQIVSRSADRVLGWEGCLSVPEQRGQVWRDRSVTVAYLDRQGQPQQQVFTDFIARIFQHEYDHLLGKVFLDRIDDPAQVISEADYMQHAAAEHRQSSR